MKTKDTCFSDPVELQKKVDAYFKHCEDSKQTLHLKSGDIKIRQEFPSMVGLALWLGVHKDTLYSYIYGEDMKRPSDTSITLPTTWTRRQRRS